MKSTTSELWDLQASGPFTILSWAWQRNCTGGKQGLRKCQLFCQGVGDAFFTGSLHVTPGSDQTSFSKINLTLYHPQGPSAMEPLPS